MVSEFNPDSLPPPTIRTITQKDCMVINGLEYEVKVGNDGTITIGIIVPMDEWEYVNAHASNIMSPALYKFWTERSGLILREAVKYLCERGI